MSQNMRCKKMEYDEDEGEWDEDTSSDEDDW